MATRTAEGIWLEMPSSGTKRAYEDIRNNVVVLAKYAVILVTMSTLNLIFFPLSPLRYVEIENVSAKIKFLDDVTSPSGNSLHHEENVTHGQFAFTTTEAGKYMACFLMNSHATPGIKGVNIGIEWKSGIAVKEWDSVARKEKIEEVELVLMKLEASVQAIHEKLIYLKKREEELREVSERINAAVERFSIMSLSICILVASLQIWYLKRFFMKKKLI